MKPGDLARLKDVGIRSGEVVLIVKVDPRPLPAVAGSWTAVDYIHDGEIVEECDSSFLEVIDESR
jgi:hypothetical protein